MLWSLRRIHDSPLAPILSLRWIDIGTELTFCKHILLCHASWLAICWFSTRHILKAAESLLELLLSDIHLLLHQQVLLTLLFSPLSKCLLLLGARSSIGSSTCTSIDDYWRLLRALWREALIKLAPTIPCARSLGIDKWVEILLDRSLNSLRLVTLVIDLSQVLEFDLNI